MKKFLIAQNEYRAYLLPVKVHTTVALKRYGKKVISGFSHPFSPSPSSKIHLPPLQQLPWGGIKSPTPSKPSRPPVPGRFIPMKSTIELQ